MDRSHPTATEARAARSACVLVVLVALASCQSYEPRPLDPEAHREAWRARTLERESLRALLQRLESSAEPEAIDEFDPTDGLSLPEAQLVALVFNPTLRLARLRAGQAAAGAEHAGLWADPTFEFSVLRITESVPDPWVITPGLAFTLPLSGRLGVERDQAAAGQRAAEAAVLEAEWSVWRDLRTAWIEWSAARLRVDELERLAVELEGLVETTSQLAASGEIPRTEASLLRVEQLQRRSQLRRTRGEVDGLEQRLRGLLGLTPTAPVELLVAIAPAGTSGAKSEDEQRQLELRNPGLARLRLEYELSEQVLRHELRKQYPDLTLGPLYESDEGQSRIGFLGGIPLPFLNANRRAIAEARAGRELARAAVEAAHEVLVARWAAATARAGSLADQREELVRELVPLVERQVEDALELLRLGEGAGTLVLLESLTRAFQARLDLIETRAAEALARTEVAFLIGPATSPEVHEPSGVAEETR